MTTATASKTALYRVERRRARRQVRHGSTLLTAQMGFLAVVLCSMALLRRYGIALSDEMVEQLDNMPLQWAATIKLVEDLVKLVEAS